MQVTLRVFSCLKNSLWMKKDEFGYEEERNERLVEDTTKWEKPVSARIIFNDVSWAYAGRLELRQKTMWNDKEINSHALLAIDLSFMKNNLHTQLLFLVNIRNQYPDEKIISRPIYMCLMIWPPILFNLAIYDHAQSHLHLFISHCLLFPLPWRQQQHTKKQRNVCIINSNWVADLERIIVQ